MSRKYRAALIDDEDLARKRLRNLLLPYEDRLELVGEASDGSEGLALVESLKPDLVFLDVQMPIMNGFEMLNGLSYQPQIIFTTAYDKYAIKAFEENSVDYLLKPIEELRLKKTIEKLDSLVSHLADPKLNMLLEQLETRQPETISVTLGDRILLVRVDEIVYFHAEDKYVFIHDLKGNKYLINTSLSALERKLGSSFLRIHRGYIINCRHIKEVQKALNSKLAFHMADTDQTTITSSHGYTPAIRKRLDL